MVHFYTRITFLGGFFLGVILAITLKRYLEAKQELFHSKNTAYESWFKKQEILRKKHVLWDTLRYGNVKLTVESQFLFNKIRVLCVVLVKNAENIKAANDTWLKGCNSVSFLYLSPKKSKVHTIAIKRRQEDSSWVLLCKKLSEIIIDKISDRTKLDWVLIVNDNTFVITENLRHYVACLNANEKHYLGHTVSFWSTVYNTGEAGYVLSKGALREFQKKIKETGCVTNSYWNREDFYLGTHLASLGITPIDTKDELGLSTFHPYSWYHVFYPGENYYKSSIFPRKCCSSRSITFQAIEGDKMYTYYYLLYTLQIFLDGNLGNGPPPYKGPDDMIWKQFLKERGIQSETFTSDQYYKLWETLVQDPTSFAKNMKREHDFDYEN